MTRAPLKASPRGLGFLTVWRSQGSWISYMSAPISKSGHQKPATITSSLGYLRGGVPGLPKSGGEDSSAPSRLEDGEITQEKSTRDEDTVTTVFGKKHNLPKRGEGRRERGEEEEEEEHRRADVQWTCPAEGPCTFKDGLDVACLAWG